MKTIRMILAFLFLVSPVATAQVMNRNMMSDSLHYRHMGVHNRQGMGGMMMPGCMAYMGQNRMQGYRMMGNYGHSMYGRNMGGGMNPVRNSMMPLHNYLRMVEMLPEMQQKLSLSEDQQEKLIDLHTAFKKEQAELQGQLAKQTLELKSMLKDDLSAEALKTQLQKCSDIRVNMQVEGYKAFDSMKNILNENQKMQLSSLMDHRMNTGGMNSW
jgi:Spy/CpxP family protein refolding chaperone